MEAASDRVRYQHLLNLYMDVCIATFANDYVDYFSSFLLLCIQDRSRNVQPRAITDSYTRTHCRHKESQPDAVTLA